MPSCMNRDVGRGPFSTGRIVQWQIRYDHSHRRKTRNWAHVRQVVEAAMSKCRERSTSCEWVKVAATGRRIASDRDGLCRPGCIFRETTQLRVNGYPGQTTRAGLNTSPSPGACPPPTHQISPDTLPPRFYAQPRPSPPPPRPWTSERHQHIL